MDLRLALDDGFSKGGIKGRRDFRIHLRFSMQKRNQIEKQGRLAPVQLMTGMKVRTMTSLSLAQGEVQIPEDLCEDMEFVKRLGKLVKDFTEYELVMRDEVARKNALRRDKSDQQTRDVDIEEGSVVSYQGKKVEIIALHGEVDRPVTATVRIMKNGTEMRVKVCELNEMAAAMPVHMLPTAEGVGQFIMWKDEE